LIEKHHTDIPLVYISRKWDNYLIGHHRFFIENEADSLSGNRICGYPTVSSIRHLAAGYCRCLSRFICREVENSANPIPGQNDLHKSKNRSHWPSAAYHSSASS
jgi:hypothetical protein